MRVVFLGFAWLALALTGCEDARRQNIGGPAPAPGIDPVDPCVGSFAKGGTRLEAGMQNCPACELQDELRAVDGLRDTHALLRLPAGGGSVSLKAIADRGHIFPAGHQAGAILRLPSGFTAFNSVLVRTWLDGSEQESHQGGPEVGGAKAPGEDELRSFRTSKPFDTVELVLTHSGSAALDPIRIYEFCAATF